MYGYGNNWERKVYSLKYFEKKMENLQTSENRTEKLNNQIISLWS